MPLLNSVYAFRPRQVRIISGYSEKEVRILSLDIFVRFEPRPGKQNQLREELTIILEPTRAEPGCTGIQLYESLRDPVTFFIHSYWIDEAAFSVHAELPHTKRLLSIVPDLITHPLQAARTKRIG
jgi:quinol monooxygenase YgiN